MTVNMSESFTDFESRFKHGIESGSESGIDLDSYPVAVFKLQFDFTPEFDLDMNYEFNMIMLLRLT